MKIAIIFSAVAAVLAVAYLARIVDSTRSCDKDRGVYARGYCWVNEESEKIHAYYDWKEK